MFAFQCTPLQNSSKIAKNQTYIINTKLSSIKFENRDITNIRSLSVGKAHGRDNTFIRMLKICNSTIVEPLSIMFNNCINQRILPDIWKIDQPIHKKDDKQIISIPDQYHCYQFVRKCLKD